MIAQEVALQIPEKLLSLTLIATHAGGWSSYIPPVCTSPLLCLYYFFDIYFPKHFHQWQMFSSFLRHPFGKSTRDQMRSLMGLVFSEVCFLFILFYFIFGLY